MTSAYIKTLETLIILGLVIMVSLTLGSTLIRLLPGQGGIFWAEEVSRYVSIWVVFLAGGLGIRYWIHLNVDIFVIMLPGRAQNWLMMFCLGLMLLFEGVLLWFGAMLTISNHAQQSASLQMPMSYAYAAIPVGAVIMIGETLRLIWREYKSEPREFFEAD
jgi:TRAP-type C4-dicarboxylate transport system permease small subunit